MKHRQAPQPLGRRGLRWCSRNLSALLVALSLMTVVVLAGVLLARPAAADRPDLTFDAMAPGIGRSQELWITSRSEQPVSAEVGVRDLESWDNGCLRPELRAGDTTCRSEGELLPWLQVRLERLDDGGAVLLYDGRLAELADRDNISLGRAVSEDSPVRLRMTVVPDAAMGNDTMTDSVRFSVWWSAAGALDEVTVAGSSGALPTSRREPGISFRPEALLVASGLLSFIASRVRRRRALPAH